MAFEDDKFLLGGRRSPTATQIEDGTRHRADDSAGTGDAGAAAGAGAATGAGAGAAAGAAATGAGAAATRSCDGCSSNAAISHFNAFVCFAFEVILSFFMFISLCWTPERALRVYEKNDGLHGLGQSKSICAAWAERNDKDTGAPGTS